MVSKNIKLSKEFKSQTTKAILAIGLFVLTYIAILASAITLTGFCIYAGLNVIMAWPGLVTLFLGAGIAGFGILILIFLIKFLFKSHKTDRSHLLEIKRADEPKLFQLIEEIVNEVGTTFPKKVYLSGDVNAAVFYDSSFWSMFLPVKKNLQIGIGLVNTVTEAELKAILSHEFGHFSQRTMKVGSYVHNVNQVIYNMLADNDSYGQLINRWASISNLISIFVIIAVKVIEGIQWILRQVYTIVNQSYMALSREMEFHADEIAAAITGYEPLKSSLLRMGLADYSFNSVLGFYNDKIKENLKSENVYKDQSYIMNFYAQWNQVPIENNFPQPSLEELNKFNKSKLVIKDQWASHPSMEERIARLEKTGFSKVQPENTPANGVFRNIEQTQNLLSSKLFETITYSAPVSEMPHETFEQSFTTQFKSDAFPLIYNGYYDHKNPVYFDLSEAPAHAESDTFESLFSDARVDLVYTSIALQNDIETLKLIADGKTEIKSFDYAGIRYTKKEANALIVRLKSELEPMNVQIKENDLRIFSFFKWLEKEQQKEAQVEDLYRAFFAFDQVFDGKYSLYAELSSDLFFINQTTPVLEIRKNFLSIFDKEVELKKVINELLTEDTYAPAISAEIKENFETYISNKWKYFVEEKYNDANLTILFNALNNYAFVLSRSYFLTKRKIMDYQESLLPHKA